MERRPSVVVGGQFALAESRMNFAVTNAVHQGLAFAAAAFWYEVVFVGAASWLDSSSAKRAQGSLYRHDVAERLVAAKCASGNHGVRFSKPQSRATPR